MNAFVFHRELQIMEFLFPLGFPRTAIAAEVLLVAPTKPKYRENTISFSTENLGIEEGSFFLQFFTWPSQENRGWSCFHFLQKPTIRTWRKCYKTWGKGHW